MALCPQCRNALPEEPPRYCPNCGADLEAAGAEATAAGAEATVADETTSGAGAAPSDPGTAEGPPPGGWPPPPPPPLPPSGGGGTGGDTPPWENRGRLGLFAALVETTKRILGEPVGFFRSMPTSGGFGAPLLYAVIIGWIGVLAAGFYSALFQSIVGTGMGSFGDRPEIAEALAFAQSWVGFLVQAVFAPVGIVIGVFLAAGVFHVALLVLGAARRDFEATLRVVSYGQAPAVVMLVPFCGSFIAWIWSLVLYVIGIAEAHGIGRGQAAAAVLLPIVLLCCCCGVLVVVFAGAIAALVSQAR